MSYKDKGITRGNVGRMFKNFRNAQGYLKADGKSDDKKDVGREQIEKNLDSDDQTGKRPEKD